MSTRDPPTVLEMLRDDPIRGGLFVATPLVVAAIQLLNSVLNGLSYLVSVPFAALMVAFAALLLSYQLAQFRVAELESETFQSSGN